MRVCHVVLGNLVLYDNTVSNECDQQITKHLVLQSQTYPHIVF